MAGFILSKSKSSEHQSPCLNRRHFLKLGIASSALLVVPDAFAELLKQPERSLSLHNLHTGETVKATYWAEGEYQLSELERINHLLRDHRTGDVNQMDKNLIDMLNLLHQKMDAKHGFEVISGYRSPKTNQMLRNNSTGVAKKSLHMLGQAIDIRLPGRDLNNLKQVATNMQVGGVGYYPKSGFIHVDTGRVRQWQG